MGNKTIKGFEAIMMDDANYVIHQDLGGNISIGGFQVLDFQDIGLFSSNSSYKALSNYSFVFMNLKDIPISYVRVQLPDCFSLNNQTSNLSTALVGRSSGEIDIINVTLRNNSLNLRVMEF
jgi:hypothetical protein